MNNMIEAARILSTKTATAAYVYVIAWSLMALTLLVQHPIVTSDDLVNRAWSEDATKKLYLECSAEIDAELRRRIDDISEPYREMAITYIHASNQEMRISALHRFLMEDSSEMTRHRQMIFTVPGASHVIRQEMAKDMAMTGTVAMPVLQVRTGHGAFVVSMTAALAALQMYILAHRQLLRAQVTPVIDKDISSELPTSLLLAEDLHLSQLPRMFHVALLVAQWLVFYGLGIIFSFIIVIEIFKFLISGIAVSFLDRTLLYMLGALTFQIIVHVFVWRSSRPEWLWYLSRIKGLLLTRRSH